MKVLAKGLKTRVQRDNLAVPAGSESKNENCGKPSFSKQ